MRVCVFVRASHYVVVGSIKMYSSVLALMAGCTDGDGHATMCVFAHVLMAGCTWMVLLYARRLDRLGLTVFCCCMALLADGWDVI